VQLVLKTESKEAKQLIKELTPLYEEARAIAEDEFKALAVDTRKAFEKKGIKGPQMNPLFTEVYDKETEEPTGEIVFKFAMKARGVSKKTNKKWSRKPNIFDAKGKRMRKLPDIWGGTVGKVAFEAVPYFIPGTAAAGLRLPLVGAQIIDLVAGGARTASSMGFEEEEGYEHTEAADTPAEDGAEETTEDDGSGDF
jgi:hypothetical protein